jgi:RNA polymerase sigma-70 factor, ECF subfamily
MQALVEKVEITQNLASEGQFSPPTEGADSLSLMEINSDEFLRALRSGAKVSQRTFRRLVQITHPKLTRFLGRYLRSQESIQEAIQETYLGVYRGLPRFQEKCRLSTWIYSLAYRKACDCLAQKYRHQALETEMNTSESEWDEMGSQELAPDEVLHQGRLVTEILTAAKVLPKIYLDVYQLRDLDGLSGEEAAEILGISETLIRVRLHRARALIVDRIRQKLPSLFTK